MIHVVFPNPLPFPVIAAVFGAILFVSWLTQVDDKTHSEDDTEGLEDSIL